MASSAYHTCFTEGELDLRRSIRGLIARVYIAMARVSPCIVPSEEETFPLPGITKQTGA